MINTFRADHRQTGSLQFPLSDIDNVDNCHKYLSVKLKDHAVCLMIRDIAELLSLVIH